MQAFTLLLQNLILDASFSEGADIDERSSGGRQSTSRKSDAAGSAAVAANRDRLSGLAHFDAIHLRPLFVRKFTPQVQWTM